MRKTQNTMAAFLTLTMALPSPNVFAQSQVAKLAQNMAVSGGVGVIGVYLLKEGRKGEELSRMRMKSVDGHFPADKLSQLDSRLKPGDTILVEVSTNNGNGTPTTRVIEYIKRRDGFFELPVPPKHRIQISKIEKPLLGNPYRTAIYKKPPHQKELRVERRTLGGTLSDIIGVHNPTKEKLSIRAVEPDPRLPAKLTQRVGKAFIAASMFGLATAIIQRFQTLYLAGQEDSPVATGTAAVSDQHAGNSQGRPMTVFYSQEDLNAHANTGNPVR